MTQPPAEDDVIAPGSVCPACYQPFPENRALPSVPVGGRVATDEARRRLWLVCGA